jgi:hypothetical protein
VERVLIAAEPLVWKPSACEPYVAALLLTQLPLVLKLALRR